MKTPLNQLFQDINTAIDGFDSDNYTGIQEYYLNLEKESIKRAWYAAKTNDIDFNAWFEETYGS